MQDSHRAMAMIIITSNKHRYTDIDVAT